MEPLAQQSLVDIEGTKRERGEAHEVGEQESRASLAKFVTLNGLRKCDPRNMRIRGLLHVMSQSSRHLSR